MPLFILFSSFIGYCAFFVETSFSYSGNYGLSKKTNEPIAYNGTTKKEYTTLDRAIKDANEANENVTVFVIPGSRFTLTDDCTINKNVTLCLPFEGDTPVAVVLQHINSIPLLPREIDPTIPQALEEIAEHLEVISNKLNGEPNG